MHLDPGDAIDQREQLLRQLMQTLQITTVTPTFITAMENLQINNTLETTNTPTEDSYVINPSEISNNNPSQLTLEVHFQPNNNPSQLRLENNFEPNDNDISQTPTL